MLGLNFISCIFWEKKIKTKQVIFFAIITITTIFIFVFNAAYNGSSCWRTNLAGALNRRWFSSIELSSIRSMSNLLFRLPVACKPQFGFRCMLRMKNIPWNCLWSLHAPLSLPLRHLRYPCFVHDSFLLFFSINGPSNLNMIM